ncbi:hypothetical protein H4V99_000704 [Cryobacterium sp. CG_9.6]|nr:hypothetical protein [Cryobacterium sp. CG_9.6]
MPPSTDNTVTDLRCAPPHRSSAGFRQATARRRQSHSPGRAEGPNTARQAKRSTTQPGRPRWTASPVPITPSGSPGRTKHHHTTGQTPTDPGRWRPSHPPRHPEGPNTTRQPDKPEPPTSPAPFTPSRPAGRTKHHHTTGQPPTTHVTDAHRTLPATRKDQTPPGNQTDPPTHHGDQRQSHRPGRGEPAKAAGIRSATGRPAHVGQRLHGRDER